MIKVGRHFITANLSKLTFSDYLKKWVVLYFYPGDFTFV